MQWETPDLPEAVNPGSGTEIVATYDAVDGTPAFVVADVGRDDAWLAVPVEGTTDLDEWQ